MEVNNPYIEKIRKLYVIEKPTDEQKQELFELQEKSRSWTQEKLVELSAGIRIVDDSMEVVADATEAKTQFPTLNKQYQESLRLYKLVMELIPKSRELKKSIRDEMASIKDMKKEMGKK